MDRWEGSTRRTMEEMKERFYNAVNELNTVRNEKAEVLYYDAEHEKRRKEQLIKQWNRTEQQVFLFGITSSLSLHLELLKFST